jgi:hypothetical protein
MKLGPLHVVTDRTMSRMQEMMTEFCRGRDAAARARDGLAAAAADREARRIFEDTLSHCTESVRLGDWEVLDPDPDDRETVERVVAAFHRAVAVTPPAPRCLWDHLEGQNGAFTQALTDGDLDGVGRVLRGMFRSSAVYGLGWFMEGVAEELRDTPDGCQHVLRWTDSLRSLAEAVGVLNLTNPEQNPTAYRRTLDFDLAATVAGVERALGLDLSFPAVGGAYGCRLGGRLYAVDPFVHAYTVHRLRQMGAEPGSSVAEIGGGYGCLALLAHRAGLRDYTVYDLPWVSALQGYFLIRTLPPGTVRLFGEEAGTVRVLPWPCFHDRPGRSVDYVVNCNSMAEMGEDAAVAYLRTIGRVTRRAFLSINQEAKVPVLDYPPQLSVAELARRVEGLTAVSRYPYWMRKGYVEEVYRPTAD